METSDGISATQHAGNDVGRHEAALMRSFDESTVFPECTGSPECVAGLDGLLAFFSFSFLCLLLYYLCTQKANRLVGTSTHANPVLFEPRTW